MTAIHPSRPRYPWPLRMFLAFAEWLGAGEPGLVAFKAGFVFIWLPFLGAMALIASGIM